MTYDKLTLGNSEDPDDRLVLPLKDANYISMFCPCCGGNIILSVTGAQSHPPQVIDGEFKP